MNNLKISQLIFQHYSIWIICLFFSVDVVAQTYSNIEDLNDHSFERIGEVKEYQGRLYGSLSSRYIGENQYAGILSEIGDGGEFVWSQRNENFNILWKSSMIFSGDSIIQVGYNRLTEKSIFINILNLQGEPLDFIEVTNSDLNVDRILPIGVLDKLVNGKLILYGQIVYEDNSDIEIYASISQLSITGEVDTTYEFGDGLGGYISDASFDQEENLHFIHQAIENPIPNIAGNPERLITYSYSEKMNFISEWRSTEIDNLLGRRVAIDAFSNGDLIVPGGTENLNDLELWRLKLSGEIEWKYKFEEIDGWHGVRVMDLDVISDGKILVSGFISPKWDNFDYHAESLPYLALVTPYGEMVWQRIFEYEPREGGKMDAFFMYGQELGDGSFSCGGAAFRYYQDSIGIIKKDYDMWLVKLDKDGCIQDDCGYITVGTLNDISPIDNSPKLGIYPNPSQGPSTIEFYLEDQCEATLELVDQLGKNQLTILSGVQIQGRNKVSLAEHDFPAGQYFLVLTTKGGRQTVPYVIVD